jgi:hypothetical protein
MSPLRSHGFRLALLYLVLFTASVLVIFAVIYWTTADYMSRALDLSVETELASLADIERSSGPAALVDALSRRSSMPVGPLDLCAAARSVRRQAGGQSGGAPAAYWLAGSAHAEGQRRCRGRR